MNSDDEKMMVRRTQLRVTEIVTYVMTLAFVGLLFVPFFREVPESGRDIMMTMKDSLVNVFMLVVGYIFGTSFGSQSKDATQKKEF